MDDCDMGSMYEQFLRDRAIAKARARHGMPACAECIDCGEPIPAARRHAVPGCRRCVACQEVFEEAGQ